MLLGVSCSILCLCVLIAEGFRLSAFKSVKKEPVMSVRHCSHSCISYGRGGSRIPVTFCDCVVLGWALLSWEHC